MHRQILQSTASQYRRSTAESEISPSPSPAPCEPDIRMKRSLSPYNHELHDVHLHMSAFEVEASAMEKHRASSLVTRAALQDASRVLDENRSLKQHVAHIQSLLAASKQEAQALREVLAAQSAHTQKQHQTMIDKVKALEHQLAHLMSARECLREEINMLRRHCFLLSDTNNTASPQQHSSDSKSNVEKSWLSQSATFQPLVSMPMENTEGERADQPVMQSACTARLSKKGELSFSEVIPREAADICVTLGIRSSAELHTILSAHLSSGGAQSFGLAHTPTRVIQADWSTNRATPESGLPPQAPDSSNSFTSNSTSHDMPSRRRGMEFEESIQRQGYMVLSGPSLYTSPVYSASESGVKSKQSTDEITQTPSASTATCEAFSVKGVVERVILGMPWPKTSASPMVLPVDSIPQMWGVRPISVRQCDEQMSELHYDISRIPSLSSRSEHFEVDLSDDSGSETPVRTTSHEAHSMPNKSMYPSHGEDKIPNSPATLRHRQSEAVHETRGEVWNGAEHVPAAGLANNDINAAARAPAGGLHLKRGKQFAVRSPSTPNSPNAQGKRRPWTHDVMSSLADCVPTRDQETELERVFLEREVRKHTSNKWSTRTEVVSGRVQSIEVEGPGDRFPPFRQGKQFMMA